MKKLSFLFGFLLLSVSSAFSQKVNNIPIINGEDTLEGPRSIVSDLMATLDGTDLIIDFASSTASQVVIINQSTNQTVYSDNFASTTQVIIDLDDEGIGEGSYQLRIYAFGKWWWGEFVLEDE
ncbi:MAG: DUF3244 domain-containing protein [Bacteroidaceae bacterium]|nr:DUF3244 domain-containing protein [Bacteroidaceae bacterium]